MSISKIRSTFFPLQARVGDEDLEPAPGEEDAIFHIARNEAEVMAMEAHEEEHDPAVAVVGNNDQHLLEVGQAVRQRVIDFLQVRQAEQEQIVG